MGLITKGMGVVLKHIKKPGKAFVRAGDKWHAKTMKLQHSKKTSEKIRGAARIIVPMGAAATAGGVMGVKDAKEEIRKRTHAAGQIGPTRSIKELPGEIKKEFKKIGSDIKSGIKKVKEKIKKK